MCYNVDIKEREVIKMTREKMMKEVANKLGNNHPLTIDFFVVAINNSISENAVINLYKFILETTCT